jgi:hypothetical protein
MFKHRRQVLARHRRHALILATVTLASLTLLAVPSAQATHLGPVLKGHDNSSATWTQITNTSTASTSETALYLFGARALYAVGNPGLGVHAWSYGAEAVVGTAIWPAIGGTGTATNGVHGISGNPNASGVYGENVDTGYGVAGRSKAIAVFGDSTADFGIGVNGQNHQNGGIGVYGISNNAGGTGVYASSSGTALKVQGRSQFTGKINTNRSGLVTIATGSAAATKCGIPLDPGAMAHATLQQNRPGIWIRAAVPNAATDCITFYVNKAVASNTVLAYMIFA